MKFNLENGPGYSIRSYQEGQVEVISLTKKSPDSIENNAIILSCSAIITPDVLIENWPPKSHEQLTHAHLEMVLDLKPELIVLGTGNKLVFPAQDVLQVCYSAGIGVEIMDTGAACRTYGVLASEGRRVAAALLIGESR